ERRRRGRDSVPRDETACAVAGRTRRSAYGQAIEIAAQVKREQRHRNVAALRLSPKGHLYDVFEIAIELRVQLARRRDVVLADDLLGLGRGGAGQIVGVGGGEQPIKHASSKVSVGGGGKSLAAQLLGGGELRRENARG